MSNLVVKAAVVFRRFDVTIITLLAIIVVAIKILRAQCWCTCRRSRVEAYSTDSSCAHKHSTNKTNKPHKGMTSGCELAICSIVVTTMRSNLPSAFTQC